MAAAATANRNYSGRVYTGKSVLSFGLTASVHIYRGTLVCLDITTGLIVAFAAYSGNYRFVGVALAEVYNLATAGQHIKGSRVPVTQEGTVVLDGSGFAITDQGERMFATDDHTVKVAAGDAIDAIYVGKSIRYISSTQHEVEIDTDQGPGNVVAE